MTKAQELADMVNKALKTDAVRLGGSVHVEVIPTGVLPVDLLLGGGIPRGRFTELFGDYSTLKSYVGYSTIAQVQAGGGTAVLIDTEHSFDPEWAESIGVNVDEMVYLTPENGEIAIDITEAIVRQGVDLIVWDSVAATLPQAEQIKREFGENTQPARLAALMSKGLRKITAANTRTAIVWINQTRINVGVMFGSPEAVPGGKALPFYASHRVSLRKSGKITREVKAHDGEKWKSTKEVTGQKIRATLEKSKLTSPHREVNFVFDLEQGEVDEPLFLFSRGLEYGFIVKQGAMYQHENFSVRGKDAFIDAIREDDELWESLMTTAWAYRGGYEPHKTEEEE